MSITTILERCCETVGEGPHWEESTQSLLFVDLLNGRVFRWDSQTGKHEYVQLDGTVGFVVPSSKGDLIIGLNRTLARLDFSTKEVTPIVSIEEDLPKNRFNDGKCDPVGRLFAGTMENETKPTVLSLEKGGLYSFDKDNKMKTHATKISISNGLAWSLDHKTLYYIDSLPRKVYAFDYDKETGDTSNQRVVIDFGEGTVETMGFPDGMCIDEEGMLWVACFAGGKVVRFDPNSGKSLREVPIPGLRTTSCCWGGPNYDELYVTCGCTGATEEELEKYPQSGSVFKVTGLGVKGLPPTVYDG